MEPLERAVVRTDLELSARKVVLEVSPKILLWLKLLALMSVG